VAFTAVTGITAESSGREWNGAFSEQVHFGTPKSEGEVMSSESNLPTTEICARIRQSGYAATQKIRIYGEEFDVLSDPFPSDDGIAIQVRSKRTLQTRVLQLPATVIHRVRQPVGRAA
jgi:hypothetical protein